MTPFWGFRETHVFLIKGKRLGQRLNPVLLELLNELLQKWNC